MKVTDVECLDRSLKLRQVIRAQNSKHVNSIIQKLALGNLHLVQEYHNISNIECLCTSVQDTLNLLTDYNRVRYSSLDVNEYESDRNLINEIASINLETYLKRKGKIFSLCILKPLTKLGLSTLGELTQAYEHEKDRNVNKSMALVISSFPKILIDISKCFNEDINEINPTLKYIQISDMKRLDIDAISTKEWQQTLKKVLGRVEEMNFTNKLNVEEFDATNIMTFRSHCKNAKIRNIYFRLIHNDFFTRYRMHKYKMIDSDKCLRCGEVETTKHLLWECQHASHIWSLYNEYMIKIGKTNSIIDKYQKLYEAGECAGITLIKIRIIQEMMQIKRPINWESANIESIVTGILKIDQYNFKNKHLISTFENKWKFLNV
jgi:hypothetical protein